MSLRISADKTALRRTVNLPVDCNDFTIVMAIKQAVARPTHSAHVLYLQTTGGAQAEALLLRGASGSDVAVGDDYLGNISPAVATLTPGLASGLGWTGIAIRGSIVESVDVLEVLHKPIGSGTIAVQETTNTPGAAAFEAMNLGDASFNAGDFGVAAWWPDIYVAHFKVYDRALSDVEVAAEIDSPTPVSSVDRISYHAFSDMDIADAVVPDAGTGTFDYFNSAPSMSADNPTYGSTPTMTLEDTLPVSGTLTAPGAPTIGTATVTGARSIQVTLTAASGTVDGYRLYAQRSGQPAFVAASGPSTATSLTGVGLNPGVGYTLWVVAFNGAGEGAPSATLSRTTYKLKVVASNLESTIASTTGMRMIVWLAPATDAETIGDKVCEVTTASASAAVYSATEDANVCTATADCSDVANAGLLAAGTPVRVQLSKDASNRSTRIYEAAVVEEA